MIERIHHLNLVVDDMEKMIAFYQAALGLRLAKQATISGQWIDAATGLSGVVADVVFLEAPSGPGIELLRYRAPEGRNPLDRGAPNSKGFRHIAFRVTDLDRLVNRLKAAGVEFVSDVQQVPSSQVDYQDERKRLVYCRDPEGNLLELCGFEPVAKPASS